MCVVLPNPCFWVSRHRSWVKTITCQGICTCFVLHIYRHSGLGLGTLDDFWSLMRQGYDYTKDPFWHDMGLVCGFLQSLLLVLRIKHKGLCWIGLPCFSFSFMSSSGHRRTALGSPYGDCRRPFVLTGNKLCTRSMILILVSICRSVSFFLENPLNSTVNYWPFVHYIMALPFLGSHRTQWSLRAAIPFFCFSINININNNFVCGMGMKTIDVLPLACRHPSQPRNMGYFGGYSLKPQLGLSNTSLGIAYACARMQVYILRI